MLPCLGKLFYLILSRITCRQGSKIHPDTWSEIKIKMLLSSRITIYHETAQSVSSAHCRFTPESPQVSRYWHQGWRRYVSVITDQGSNRPGTWSWPLTNSPEFISLSSPNFLPDLPGPVLTISSLESDWSARREKPNTDVFIYKMLA